MLDRRCLVLKVQGEHIKPGKMGGCERGKGQYLFAAAFRAGGQSVSDEQANLSLRGMREKRNEQGDSGTGG